MNAVLLDTHVFVWALAVCDRVPDEAWEGVELFSRRLACSCDSKRFRSSVEYAVHSFLA